MNTQTTAAEVEKEYLRVIIGTKPPRMFTDWQVELLIHTAVDRLTQEFLESADRIKSQIPEVFTPAPQSAEDFRQWRDAIKVKAHYFPELLSDEEKQLDHPTGKWDDFTAAELSKAVELMITPDDLTIREAATALLDVFSYTPEDVREIISKGEYFNAGAVFSGLATDTPQIINNTGRLA